MKLDSMPKTENARNASPSDPILNWRVFLGACLALLATRLYIAATLPIGGDEAYYWMWSKHPAWGYYDHPPLVAWVIGLFTRLGGDHEIWVRILFVLLASLTPLLLYHLVRLAQGSDRAASIAGLCLLMAPIYAAKALEASPDSLIIFFSLLYIYLLYRILFRDQTWLWPFAGLCLALAFLSKIMALFLLPSLVIFLFLSARKRIQLTRPGFYLHLLTALLCLVPHIGWSIANNWQTYVFQLVSRQSPDAYSFRFQLPDFLLMQLAAISPLLLVMALFAALLATRLALRDQREEFLFLFLILFFYPAFLLFAAVSVCQQVFVHWTLIAYPSLFAALGLIADRQQEYFRRSWRVLSQGFIITSLAIGLLMILLAYLVSGIMPELAAPFSPRGLNEIYAHARIIPVLEQVQEEMEATIGPTFLISDSYGRSSAVAFYSGKKVHLLTYGQTMGREYLKWENFHRQKGQNAIYFDRGSLDRRQDIKQLLEKSFVSVEPMEPVRIEDDHGNFITTYFLVKCRDLRHNLFEQQPGY